MKNAFGFLPNNITIISDWHQLLSLNSDIDNVKCAISDIRDDLSHCMTITIYNKLSKLEYVKFVVEGFDDSIVDMTTIVVPKETAISILNLFGYKVQFGESFEIDRDTKKALKSLYNLGYRFICKNVDGDVFASQFDTPDIIFKTGKNICETPIYKHCDFKFMETAHSYAILQLVD